MGRYDRWDWLVCGRTRAALERLDAVLLEAIQPEDLQLRVMALAVVKRGGKRLRPALALLAAAFGEADPRRLLQAAAALELVHVASLYHDDVMDRAPLRRGEASVNARWGNAPAAAAGTYLFARATALLAGLGDGANHLASRASVELCSGQLQEVENAYNLELSETVHLAILRRKTATLFELPCRLGALLSGLSAQRAESLAAYGRFLGLAFQLADDALDLTAESDQVGKATGADLRAGIYSLPVLLTLRSAGTAGPRLAALLEQVRLGEGEIQTALRLVRETGLAPALATARVQAERARGELAELPAGPARESLWRLAGHAVERSF
jgi:heptaprenyl diphosphate synthase